MPGVPLPGVAASPFKVRTLADIEPFSGRFTLPNYGSFS